MLAGAERPLVWAGSGVLRSGAWEELRAVAETLRAPVVTSYMGKGAFPEDHELSAGSACDEAAFRELVEGADAVLVVGPELGAETTQQYALQFGGQLVQIDANEERIGATFPALGLVGDARATLAALCTSACRHESPTAARRSAPAPSASGSTPGSTSRGASSSAACSNPYATRSRATPCRAGT